MTFSSESNAIRAARLTKSPDSYLLGQKHGRLEERKRILTLLGYLEKTSGKNRAGITEAIELIRGLSNVQ